VNNGLVVVEDVVVVGNTRKRAKPTKTALPDDFVITPALEEWARQKGHTRLPEHLESFKAKVKANGYTYVDWNSAFQEAIRGDWAKLGSGSGSSVGSSPAASRRLE
jgi:hypothetical protein